MADRLARIPRPLTLGILGVFLDRSKPYNSLSGSDREGDIVLSTVQQVDGENKLRPVLIDHFIQGAEARLCHDFPQVLRDEAHKVDGVGGISGIGGAEIGVLFDIDKIFLDLGGGGWVLFDIEQ